MAGTGRIPGSSCSRSTAPRCSSSRPRRSSFRPREVGVDTGAAVRVNVAEHGQLSGASEHECAAVAAEGEQRRSLPLVADDGGGGGVDGHCRRAAEYLHEGKRQRVRRRESELVPVELGVGRHDGQLVAARVTEHLGGLVEVVADADLCRRPGIGSRTRVKVKVVLVDLRRLRYRAVGASAHALVVLVPVAGRESRGVDCRLLVATVDVGAAGVDGQSEHREQHQDQEGDQHDGLAFLQASLCRLHAQLTAGKRAQVRAARAACCTFSSSIRHGKPHMQR